MADAYSDLFESSTSSRPKNGKVVRPMGGVGCQVATVTDADLSGADGDFIGLIPVPSGGTILGLFWDFVALDGGAALDADLILRRVVDGVETDTVLVNAGATWQSAEQAWELFSQAVGDDDESYGIIGLLANTAAASASSGDSELMAIWA